MTLREPHMNFESLRKLLNQAALTDWTIQEIQRAEDWDDPLYGNVVMERVLRAAHAGRQALACLASPDEAPQETPRERHRRERRGVALNALNHLLTVAMRPYENDRPSQEDLLSATKTVIRCLEE